MVMGRPKKDNSNTVHLTFKSNPHQVERLKEYCKTYGRTQSEVIRTALDRYLNRSKPKKPEE